MSFFGFSSKKEVEEKEREAKEAAKGALLQKQQSDLGNLAKGSQIKFVVPYFDVFDTRFENFAMPVAVHGTMVYAIENMERFISINKTQNVNDGVFEQKLRGQLTKYIKSVVVNAPADNNIQVLQMERKILEISELVQRLVTPKIEELFAVNVRSIDITQINVDKESRGYRELKAVTQDLEKQNLLAQQQASLSNFNLQNSLNQELLKTQSQLQIDALMRQQNLQLGGQEEIQAMNLENQRETMRIQREEMQRAARLQTESNFLGAHQANLNANVVNTQRMFANHQNTQVPQMLEIGGMPQMPGTMPIVQYMVGVNGQQAGPFDWNQLQQLVNQGQLTQQSYVWKQGMAQWEFAGNIQELQALFMGTDPQMPPILSEM